VKAIGDWRGDCVEACDEEQEKQNPSGHRY
jgi:hypothetical protein